MNTLAIRLVGAFFLGAGAIISGARSQSNSMKLFTAPDGAFRFRYSDQLIDCGREERKGGGVSVANEACASYFPMCDGVAGDDQALIACFAYPRNKFTDTQSFEAATFSVEAIKKIRTEKDCEAGPPDPNFRLRSRSVTIRGVPFKVFAYAEGGMNQALSADVYRAFHRGTCYQLGINVATANSQTFDPPARQLTKEDWLEVKGQLEQARDSFRFLR